MATDRRRYTLLCSLVLLQLIIQIKAKSSVIDLNEDNWHQMLEGEWMVEFFAPWCPACKALKPIWEDFATWSTDLAISVGQVDVTSSPGLSGRFMVTALPTIYHVKEGVFRQYRGSRDKDEFMSFVEERRWEAIEEVPAWKSPASLQMSVVSQFFKLSMVLRSVHSVLVEDYGLPTWGSYLVFALATILVGALLGLILVCVIDFVFPPKAPGPAPVVTSAGLKADDDEEDLVEDSEVRMEDNIQEDTTKEETLEGEKSDKEVEQEDEDGEEEEEEEDEDEEKAQSESEDKEKDNSQAEDGKDTNAEEDKESKSSPEVRRRRPRKD
ncbi:thioredoxin-related transmembrane protein 1 [Procambarus clarkii]|uniref:thioredoxin-related transmembrane protein 1 n=1 Tax=Procambarus clarkii TaxID=6728 RepID=UPI001E67269C|nr:thioredoxin-related transmembrane protein 1-like isoform X2 [Procambarus clarkii]